MTPFGEKMRQLRKRQGVTQKQMAEALGVSSAYLSALEHGNRSRPSWYLVQGINQFFNLIWDEAEEIERLANLSHPRVAIDTSELSAEATELANLLSTKFSSLDDRQIRTIRAVVTGEDDKPSEDEL
ncbi:MAG: helix-turn-helix domain-containing protein [Pseudomonadota bacterium]